MTVLPFPLSPSPHPPPHSLSSPLLPPRSPGPGGKNIPRLGLVSSWLRRRLLCRCLAPAPGRRSGGAVPLSRELGSRRPFPPLVLFRFLCPLSSLSLSLPARLAVASYRCSPFTSTVTGCPLSSPSLPLPSRPRTPDSYRATLRSCCRPRPSSRARAALRRAPCRAPG